MAQINQNYRTLPNSAIIKILVRKYENVIFPALFILIAILVVFGAAISIVCLLTGYILMSVLYFLSGVSTGIVVGVLGNELEKWIRDLSDVDEIVKNWDNYYLQ